MPTDHRQPQVPPPTDLLEQLRGAASTLQTQQNQRQRLQQQVFRPTVALPTVSVEQQVSECSWFECETLHEFTLAIGLLTDCYLRRCCTFMGCMISFDLLSMIQRHLYLQQQGVHNPLPKWYLSAAHLHKMQAH